ncbi:Na+/H+ antiporter NhaA [Streptomyces olivaceoviridis]|uniref:Na+/H+ antiporter NhaA n=1 Tax=Streptomyces olivaceoviridis TaxID=1921 RepID=UPI000D14C505|nr:Na+/H+ antiporter NhaA [Streptomyces corchorusii]
MGSGQLGLDLRTGIDSGLMTSFFLLVGLEARRELDLEELRERHTGPTAHGRGWPCPPTAP